MYSIMSSANSDSFTSLQFEFFYFFFLSDYCDKDFQNYIE